MFYLHASNKTENLLLHLAKLIEADPLDSIFAQEYILIQSQGMERMISQYLAEYFTSWCNYRFLLPVVFLQDIAKKLGMEITPDAYERSYLGWRIEDKLRSIEADVYAPLRQYLSGEQVERKRFQLAHQLANIFDQYQLMRPRMLKSWENKRLCLKEKAESWQMHLWNRLVAEESVGRHRGELLHEVTTTLHQGESLGLLPQRVAVFGVHILPPFFLDYLSGLAKHCDVHLFLLSPCRHYWGDMDRRQAISARPGEMTLQHPLLISLGKQGRDFQNLLLEKVAIEHEFVSYEEPGEGEGGGITLLHRLQSDLLEGRLSDPANASAPDGSIRIVSCHSRLRELQVLKDHIIHLLDNDERLQLRDIVVMAPDIQEYAPFIAAVFEDIQHSIADRSLRRRNAYIAAFLEFLELLNGRFGWSEVLDLFEKEQIFPHFGLNQSDFERLRHWVVSAGIRWGLSAQTRAAEGIGFSENSWREGLDRLLMGYAVDSDAEIAGILPYTEIEGSEAKPLGGLCRFISVVERAEHDFKRGRGLRQWSELLLDYAENLFGGQDERDFLELQDVLRELGDCGAFHRGIVRLEVIGAWFEHSSGESRSAGGFLKGHLTFCSMLPMRSIPFTAVCLIGMNYGVFPGSDPHSTFDLMKREPLPGDRSLRADDRYQFLEVLSAARESLYIGYIGQSPRNNDPLPPAVVVTELLEVLENHYQAKGLVEQHPLHGFSSRYFAEGSRFFSYSEADYLAACKRGERREESTPWWRGSISVEQGDIDPDDMLRFYSNPQLYFVQRRLGVYLGEDGPLPEESEVFESLGLQSYGVNQLILKEMAQNTDAGQLKRRLCLDGLWPLGTPGEIAFAERKKEVRIFATRLENEAMGQALPDLECNLTVGPYRLAGRLSNRFEGGILLARYADLRAKDILRGWLHHQIGTALGASACTKIVMKNSLIHFREGDCQGPGLEKLIDVYMRGKSRPSKLLLEPGLEYCRQKLSSRARISPLQKAGNCLRTCLDNGYEPAWSLLYRNLEDESVIDDEFVEMTEQILLPLWSRCHGC
jgi:exodeoxyribonuclease V gamma subunit